MSTIAERLAEGAGRPVHVLARQPVADAALVELVAARGEPGEHLWVGQGRGWGDLVSQHLGQTAVANNGKANQISISSSILDTVRARIGHIVVC